MTPQTKQNLNIAMQSEAFAHVKYLRFAAHARTNENWGLAQLFQKTADADRTEHFAKEAELAGLAANDSENLRHAIQEKDAEVAMYRRFAREAVVDSDVAAAALFESIRADLVTQLEAFETAFRIQARECSTHLVEV